MEPEDLLSEKEFEEVLEFKPDFMLFPTLATLKVYRKHLKPEQIQEIEDDLLDMWKYAILEKNQ